MAIWTTRTSEHQRDDAANAFAGWRFGGDVGGGVGGGVEGVAG